MAKAASAGEELTLKVILDPSDDTPVYYINFAEVSHSANEFGLSVTA
jgi:hypothetical protein